jgi:hypothetical protein
MSVNNLIAPCGMNCGICLALLRDKNRCLGCRIDSSQKPESCKKCIIINCQLLKNTDSKFCYDCEKFPCKRLKQLDKRYRTKYYMSMIENLEFIKKSGLDKFVNNELVRWRCSTCGATLCVHRNFCLDCKTLPHQSKN